MEFIKVDTEREGMKLYDAKSAPFRLYGVFHDGERYRRVPADVAEATNPGVFGHAKHTAGGRVRFVTDSPYVFIKAVYDKAHVMTHMPLSGSSSFDMYVYEDGKEIYNSTFRAPMPEETVGGYEGIRDWGSKQMRTININFPLYNSVDELYIGLDENATVEPAPDYKYEKPIVYYGSSITQGGCASRPGKSYQDLISRKYDINYTNLGFSGSAKGEPAMREFLADREMSAFVCDYDHNAPTVEHLAETHYPLYEAIRAKHPNIPYIMVTRPGFFYNATEVDRRAIIMDSYLKALRSGDRNVWFVDGAGFFRGMDLGDWSVDNCHPTDDGFEAMAASIGEVIGKLLEKGLIKE
jgi:hypothetical protein